MNNDSTNANKNTLIYELDNIQKQLSRHHTWRSNHAKEDAVDDLLFKMLEERHLI